MFQPNSLVFLLGAAGVFALPHGVYLTAMGIEDGGSSRLWTGLVLFVVGTFGMECLRRIEPILIAETRREKPDLTAEAERKLRQAIRALRLAGYGCLQFLTVSQFFLMLDGHVHFRGCLCVYLVYVNSSLLVIALQQHRTPWGSRHLQWVWAPIIAFGLPLALPTLKAVGLVWFSPIRW